MEQLEGTIEQVVYYNPDNGYSVFKLETETGEVTVVGIFPPLSPGEHLKLTGHFEVNQKFGRQFQMETFSLALPHSTIGLERFLASGLIKGIGPVLARRIIKKFGVDTARILDEQPEKLTIVPGHWPEKLAEILTSWQEHREIKDLIIFLQEHGISTTMAYKIYRTYGASSFDVLKRNPYQLCLEIWGIGFKTADQIALKLGLPEDSLDRVKAFVLYLLEKDNDEGHVYSEQAEVIRRCQEELGAEAGRVEAALAALVNDRSIIAKETPSGIHLYRPFFYQAEEEVARRIISLTGRDCPPPDFDLDRKLRR